MVGRFSGLVANDFCFFLFLLTFDVVQSQTCLNEDNIVKPFYFVVTWKKMQHSCFMSKPEFILRFAIYLRLKRESYLWMLLRYSTEYSFLIFFWRGEGGVLSSDIGWFLGILVMKTVRRFDWTFKFPLGISFFEILTRGLIFFYEF